RQLLDKYRKIRPQNERRVWKQPGMIESATLAPAERTSREIERLRRDAANHPEDAQLQLHLASPLLPDGRADDSMREFRVLLAGNADSRTWHEAGTFLLGFEQYSLARKFLERAAAARPDAILDLAMAVYFLEGPVPALNILERSPMKERSGD